MKVFRAKQVKALEYIAERFESEDYSKEHLLNYYSFIMKENPDRSFLALIIDGNDVLGFLFASCLPGENHVFIHNAWASSDLAVRFPDGTKKVFLMLMGWTDQLGITEIRAQTVRNSEAFYRRWGFVEHAKILSLKLPEDFGDLVMETLKNGRERRRRTEERINTDGSAEEGFDGAGEAPDIGAEKRSLTVSDGAGDGTSPVDDPELS